MEQPIPTAREFTIEVAVTLSWMSGTAEGARLGQMAVSQVSVQQIPSPWWVCPWEPWRWFFEISGAAAHSFDAAVAYSLFSLVLGAAAGRRHGLRAGIACFLTSILILVGGLTIAPFITTRLPYGFRWVVPPQAPFRLANLHCHTQASGGAVMPEEALCWHLERGYSVVAITDSNKVYPGRQAQEDAARLELPLVVVPGEEYRGQTHLLMLNLKEAISADEVPIPEAIRRARAQGATVIAAHSWTGLLTPRELTDYGVQGFEATSRWTVADADVLDQCTRHHLAELGSLDFRGGVHPRTATVLPVWADTPEKVQQALEQGECAALYSQEWAEPTRFSRLARLRHLLPEMYREGGHLLLPGLLCWIALGGLVMRGLRGLPPAAGYRGLLKIVFLAMATGVVGIWSVWWKFKLGWFPRFEWTIGLWCAACPICLRECWRLRKTTPS